MSTETYKHLVLDAGQIRIGYVDEDNPGALLGTTRGGSVFAVEGELREMPVDGAKGPVKGSERVSRVTASLECTIIEFVSWILRLALPGASRANWPEAQPTHDEIKRYLTFSLDGYNDSIALIAEVMDTAEPIILLLSNVIGKGGLAVSLIDNDEAGIKVKFEASFDPDEISVEPWSIRSIKEISVLVASFSITPTPSFWNNIVVNFTLTDTSTGASTWSWQIKEAPADDSTYQEFSSVQNPGVFNVAKWAAANPPFDHGSAGVFIRLTINGTTSSTAVYIPTQPN